ncbi:phosphotransferase enzyme family protein [Citreimonas salinaria]|uniref:Ser/Thr protein kinase RdoA involved in Cpx stress response, MazF antagonist n=1 Tax=Citreimonas salinaria TaxID=321339 RepID=A0A1H3FHD6_9RHOB|nr:phosphotransferase [Citreimonas salinaria]SDX90386.1 Ser/Thr protein kinase RdoA involved in Cpx stress response, MazF antagonist [Citreimonas salinaria]
MSDVVDKALSLWGMAGAHNRLIAARENSVFRVDHGGVSFALRLHRQGYRSDAELWSELEWMAAVAQGGLLVPSPVRSASGHLLEDVSGVQVDMLSWLPGQPLGESGLLDDPQARRDVFSRIGHEMARLHAISDKWKAPEGFTRCAWDRDGLLGADPLWGRFWDNPALSEGERTLFRRVRDEADRRLESIEDGLDYGLIHADLVRENVMVDGSRVQLIDFDDSGYGFRLFDLATTLVKFTDAPDYPALRHALVEGYRSQRGIDTTHLDFFVLLRALTYVGWIIDRMHEGGASERNTRYLGAARALADQVLGIR